jgi:two-component system NtrC family sensor kinase
MKNYSLSLFNKFALATILIVILFGITNLFFLWNSTYHSFENEIDKRSRVLSRIIAERILQPIVYHDLVGIYRELDEIKSNDPSVAYIFILDGNDKVVAQTYNIHIPYTLIKANRPQGSKENIQVIQAKNFTHDVIRDIAYPVLDGKLGTVRLGLIEESIRKDLNIASRSLILMVLSFLLIGLIGAFFFSFMITLPIKSIVEKAQSLNLKDIDNEDFKVKKLRFRNFFGIYFSDELDILVSKFNEMMVRLKGNKKELDESRNSVIQAEKLASIGTLTAGISHEINNPLTGIKNCIQRIEKDPNNSAQNLKYFELIKDATNRIEDVVRPMLDYSRKNDIRLSSFSPCQVIEKNLKMIDYKIKKNQLIIEKECEPSIMLKSNSNLFEQVVFNLFLNSIDTIEEKKRNMPEHVGKIKVDLYKNSHEVYIKITDNGMGIPAEYQRKIFDPFFTSKGVGKGTGLGLYVSYKIIQELGGQISFQTEPGQGTTFIIKLADQNEVEAV